MNGQGDPSGHRLRQSGLVGVDTLVAPFQRSIVAVGDELDDDILLAGQVIQRLPDLLLKILRHRNHGRVIAHGIDQVLYPNTVGLPFLVAHLADRLGAADLDAVHLAGNNDLLFHHLFTDLVIPDLDLNPSVERPPLFGGVAGDGLTVALPFIGDGFGGQAKGSLAIFGGGAGPLAGETGIVAVFGFQGTTEGLGIGVADKVKTHVEAAVHLFEHTPQKRQILLGNVRFTGAEMNRGNQVGQLDCLHILFRDQAFLGAVTLVLRENGGIKEPGGEGFVLWQVLFSRFAEACGLSGGRRSLYALGRRSFGADGGFYSGWREKKET